MRNRIRIRSLKAKIILLFIVFASLILFLQIVVFQKWIGAIIIEKSESYFQETVHQIGQRADMQFSQFRTMALGISNNQVVKNYLADVKDHNINYQIAKYKITNEIFRISRFDWIESMCIYPAGSEPPMNLFYTKPVFEAEPRIRAMLAEPPGAGPDAITWAELQAEPDSISALLPIRENEIYGILRISLSETFFEPFRGAKLGKQGALYLVKDHVILYAKDRSLIGSPAQAIGETDSVREATLWANRAGRSSASCRRRNCCSKSSGSTASSA
ncbi:hypothetical protein SD70_29225 [Gordoniibacillus kamchatkensis]|uniref:Uncharacterized protein n=1 Tax=Gordoniibacillus kamchatkensis TaxID=1590651 RepID=A0ABR5AAM3_9BACL|nr:cache domain-containing protein [Paenibacillus sp. VKM B-2647]KIL38015.1 hypothetical protein SD70_29225 [Paenibacillus sp. VKM B-2647]